MFILDLLKVITKPQHINNVDFSGQATNYLAHSWSIKPALKTL